MSNHKEETSCSCVICGATVAQFLPYRLDVNELRKDYKKKYKVVGSDIKNFSCPSCGATDRERHLALYFGVFNFFKKINDNTKILHLAPEPRFSKILSFAHCFYMKGDLFPEHSPVDNVIKMDITDIPFKDNFFDLIICNHVLEHIVDDKTAMKELFRVLNKNGLAILQTPYAINIEYTYEDDSITSPEERLYNFGQEDHVRVYAKNDFLNRLKEAGFILAIKKSSDYFTSENARKYGFNNEEDLILCLKSNTAKWL